MSIPTLTNVDQWPTRKLPQFTFDTSVRTSMNQMSTMVGELNSGVIPGINAVTADVNTVVANLAAIQAAPTNAANAAASATAAAGSAHEAAASANSADVSAIAAAASAAEAADIVGIEVSEDAGVGKTPKATALGVLKDEWLDGGLFKPGMLVASQAPLSAPEWLETGREYLNTAYPALREVLGTKTNEHPINLSNDLNTSAANSPYYRFSPDGQYLLAARHGSNSFLSRITVWKRDGTTLTALTSPTSPQPGISCAVAWFPDSVHFAVAGSGALYIGKVENDVVSIIKTVTDSAISYSAVGVSPNGTYIAISLNVAPYIRICTHDTDWNLTTVTVPAGAASAAHFNFSPDGTHLVSRTNGTATIYKNTAPGVFTQLTAIAAALGNGECATSWHPSGEFLAIPYLGGASQYALWVYRRSGDTYTQFARATYDTSVSTIPGCSFTPDGRHIVFNINKNMLPIYRFLPNEETIDSRLLLINLWTTPAMTAAPTISPDCQLCITGAAINLLGYDADTSFHVPDAKADFAQTIYVKS